MDYVLILNTEGSIKHEGYFKKYIASILDLIP